MTSASVKHDELKRKLELWLEGKISSYFAVRNLFHKSNSILIRYEDKETPRASNSYAVVVTYFPNSEHRENIRKLIGQFNQVVIVDNTPGSNLSFFNELVSEAGLRLTLLSNENRNGIAGALNLATRLIYKNFKNGWVFWFDQDTEVDDWFVQDISDQVSGVTCFEETLFGVNYQSSQYSSDLGVVEVETVITSGSFMRVENLKRVGLFIDEMFIDSVDQEYCLRAKVVGMNVKLISKFLMKHSLGHIECRTILGKRVDVTNHPSFRWYYFFRNLIFCGFEHLPSSGSWMFSHGCSLLKNLLKVLLFEEHKFRKICFAVFGIIDGTLFVMGASNGIFRRMLPNQKPLSSPSME